MDELIACPYNSQHRIIRHRLPYHIVKCKKNYNGPPLKMCPYNAMHMMLSDVLKSHVIDCPDRQIIMQEEYLKETLPTTLLHKK